MKARKVNILLATMALSMAVTATGCGAKKDHTESVQATDAVEAVVETETEEATETETEEVTEEPTEAVTEEPAEVSDGYTYEEMDSTMYASSKVNVRSTPSQDGEKFGTLKKGEEVKVTGKCVETGWLRIAYGDGNGFVSDKYVTETAASGTTNSASSSKDGKKDSKSNGTACSATGKQQNTGSTASGGQSAGTTTGTTTGGKTNSSATSGSNSSNSNNNQSTNNNSGNNGSSNNGNSGNSNTGNSGSGNNGGSSNNGGGNSNSGNNGGSSNNGNSGNSGSTSGLPSYEDSKANADNGVLAPGDYVDKDGNTVTVAPTQPADWDTSGSFGEMPDFSGEDSETP
mgnify:CR=1 FL=1